MDLPPEVLRAYEPTEAPAGSADKLEVFAQRASVRAPLFHPDDSPQQVPPPLPPDTPDERKNYRDPRRSPGVNDLEE
jgi:hypothetical protein